MKRTLTQLSVLLFLTSICFSQVTPDKGYIAISGGPSFPTGDFANDKDNIYTGLANTGFVIAASSQIPFSKNFRVSLLLDDQPYSIDDETILDVLEELQPNINWSAKSDSWVLIGLLGGLYGSFPVDQGNTSFDFRAMIGSVFATSPEINVTGSDQGKTVQATVKDGSATSFAYMLGDGVRYNVSSQVCLLGNVDYLGTSPEFKNVTLSGGGVGNETTTLKQDIGTVNISFGVG